MPVKDSNLNVALQVVIFLEAQGCRTSPAYADRLIIEYYPISDHGKT